MDVLTVKKWVSSFILLLLIISCLSCGGGEDKGPVQNPPTVTITGPNDFSTHIQGDVIQFTGRAEDAEDGALSGDSLVWTSSIDGRIGTGASLKKLISAGQHTITLTATDSKGAAASASITVIVSSIIQTG